jgi:hypothetical protein
MFFQDCKEAVSFLETLEKSQLQVNGLFVNVVDVFSHPDTHVPLLIRKRIPKASQLPGNSRAFEVMGAYGFCERGRYGRRELREDRPILNLLMLKFFLHALEMGGFSRDFFSKPKIVLNGDSDAFQVMEYVDTTVKIFGQNLPRRGDTLRRLVLNLCEAACLANVTFQGDCCTNNLCLVRDEFGEICDIRMFDSDIMDSGDDGDSTVLLDFTNLADFDAKSSFFQKTTDIGCLDMRAALPPLISRNSYDALRNSLSTLKLLAFSFSSNRSLGIPFMLRDGGLLERWMSRVMVLDENGRLYKNAASEECIEFDEAAALFVLHRLGCSNRARALFACLSFVDLGERYGEMCTPQREDELVSFFRQFGFEEWETVSASLE